MRFPILIAILLGTAVTAHAEPPTLVIGPSVSTTYPQAFPVHGIGGDGLVIFALQPTDVPGHDRGIWVSRRGDGAHLGAIAAPPGGWGSPLAIKVIDYHSLGLVTSGRFLVLDGFTPQQAGLRPGILYEYQYSYVPLLGLHSTLLATHPLPLFTGVDELGLPNGPIYPISLALLPGGGAVVIDMLAGGVWVAGASLADWRLGIIDARFEVGELDGVITGIGRAPGGGTRPYQFATVGIPPEFPFPILPGIHGVAYCNPTDEVAVLRTATPGGIYGIPRAVLLDETTPPFAKSAAVRDIVPPTAGLSDLAVGLDYDRFNPSTHWIYWQRVVANANPNEQNTVYRADLYNGEVEELANSVQVYNWTNEISVLPSLLPELTVLTNANMQEENVAESNALLDGVSTLVGPTIVPIATFSNW